MEVHSGDNKDSRVAEGAEGARSFESTINPSTGHFVTNRYNAVKHCQKQKKTKKKRRGPIGVGPVPLVPLAPQLQCATGESESESGESRCVTRPLRCVALRRVLWPTFRFSLFVSRIGVAKSRNREIGVAQRNARRPASCRRKRASLRQKCSRLQAVNCRSSRGGAHCPRSTRATSVAVGIWSASPRAAMVRQSRRSGPRTHVVA